MVTETQKTAIMNNALTIKRLRKGAYSITLEAYGIEFQIEDLKAYGNYFMTEDGESYSNPNWELTVPNNYEVQSEYFTTLKEAKGYLQYSFNPEEVQGFTMN